MVLEKSIARKRPVDRVYYIFEENTQLQLGSEIVAYPNTPHWNVGCVVYYIFEENMTWWTIQNRATVTTTSRLDANYPNRQATFFWVKFKWFIPQIKGKHDKNSLTLHIMWLLHALSWVKFFNMRSYYKLKGVCVIADYTNSSNSSPDSPEWNKFSIYCITEYDAIT